MKNTRSLGHLTTQPLFFCRNRQVLKHQKRQLHAPEIVERVAQTGNSPADFVDVTRNHGIFDSAGDLAVTKNEMWFSNVRYNVTPAAMISLEWLQMISEYELATPWRLAALGYPYRSFADGVVNRYTLSFWYTF